MKYFICFLFVLFSTSEVNPNMFIYTRQIICSGPGKMLWACTDQWGVRYAKD